MLQQFQDQICIHSLFHIEEVFNCLYQILYCTLYLVIQAYQKVNPKFTLHRKLNCFLNSFVSVLSKLRIKNP